MSNYSNAIAVTHLLLKSLYVKHSFSGLVKKLEEHPEYPSLLAVSDCLTEWLVPNEAFQVFKDNLDMLEYPYLAHLKIKGENFILVHSIADGRVKYSDEKKLMAFMSTEEFLQRWSGTILVAEANVDSREPDYSINKWIDYFQLAKIPVMVMALLTAIGLTIYSSALTLTLPYFLILLINLLGIAITTLLLNNSMDNNNPLVQNLCSLGSKNGCNAILKTDAAKLTNWLSWSEVGFFYFVGSLLSLLFIPSSLILLVWLNLLALPYCIYSIVYQYKYKNWCVLCCTVQVLLVLGDLTALNFSLFTFNFENLLPNAFYLLPFCFLFPVLLWYILKPFFVKSVQFKPLKQQLKKFKYNSELFNQVLKNQPRYAIANEMMPVTIGNPNAETIITMVSNPFCGPCAKAHQTIDEWLKYRDDLQLKIIFTTADHDDDEKTKVSRHIGALTTMKNADLVEKALNDWYAQDAKQYEIWAQKYPITFNGEMNKVTEKQKIWCDMAEITFTPTILVNGYKLPDPYRLEDIKYLLS